jgi:hypothetical protein
VVEQDQQGMMTWGQFVPGHHGVLKTSTVRSKTDPVIREAWRARGRVPVHGHLAEDPMEPQIDEQGTAEGRIEP